MKSTFKVINFFPRDTISSEQLIAELRQLIKDQKQLIAEQQQHIEDQQQMIKELKKREYSLLEEVEKLNDELTLLKINDASEEEEEEELDEVSPVAENEDEAEWLSLKDHEDKYEIKNYFPYPIRRKDNNYEVKESVNKTSGYVRVSIDRKSKQKHIIIAKQFKPNPNQLPIVDHIDHDKTNYNVSNLRLISSSDNSRNKSSTINSIVYEYINNIPDDSTVVEDYNDHQFNDYYFCNDVFYFYNGINYRKLHINERKNGSKYVYMIDIDDKQVAEKF